MKRAEPFKILPCFGERQVGLYHVLNVGSLSNPVNDLVRDEPFIHDHPRIRPAGCLETTLHRIQRIQALSRNPFLRSALRLSRWPGHFATAQHMEVKVEHRLAALPARVRYHAIACVDDALPLGH